MDLPVIKINNISKIYTDKVGYKIHLLENISFEINKKEFVTVLAPKGSGKTTLLKIISKLENSTTGNIEQNGKVVFIPSKPSSFPWLNVEQNIKFHANKSAEEIGNIISTVELSGYEDHFPHNKSEGFRFRISIGRALAHDPEIIVIDEPFNNLNSVTKKEIYMLLRKIYKNKSITFVLGTTNISEAIFLSDKIYLMKKNPGEIINKLSIDLPIERKIEIIDTTDFIKYRTEIEDIFNREIDSQLYNFSI